jgi:hypothetical protein
MENKTKLKQCPFCGSKAELVKTSRNEYRVKCTRLWICYSEMNETDLGFTYEKDAVELWNRRPKRAV